MNRPTSEPGSQDDARPAIPDDGVRPRDSDGRTLDQDVEHFVEALKAKYPDRLARRPKALKKRVLQLIRLRLPPHPRPAGRPARLHITRAWEMYRQQRRELGQGKHAEINWAPIGKACISGFGSIRSELKRRIELTKLRNAVYARARRKRKAHKRHAPSSDLNTPTAC